jgi:hypothetical protein
MWNKSSVAPVTDGVFDAASCAGSLRLVSTFGGVYTTRHPITTTVAVWHGVLYLSRAGFGEGIPIVLKRLDRVDAISLVPVVPVLMGRVYQGR